MNLTAYCSGFNDKQNVKRYFENTIEDVIYDGKNINSAIYQAGEYILDENDRIVIDNPFENMYFIPGSINVDKRNKILFVEQESFPQYYLKDRLAELDDSWDMIMLDCSPGENLLTVMSLVASDFVLKPITPDINALSGLETCNAMIAQTKKTINPNLRDIGCVINSFKERESLSQFIFEQAETEPSYVFSGKTIRHTSKVPTAILLKEGIINVEKYLKGDRQTNKISDDFIALGEYILKKCED